ncbi:hypothetical protein J1TS1_25280 [Shouchella clausii]|uniref:hypothetical protein n=1 Tax=Shouchella clausii TaxID=79880 RepID=UPI001B20E567|nr:hypothetical protein [Shouchella clausii]GIN08383.1 hypothetical protein J1TS1_25280 [Shouchella clausii]
MDKSKALLAVVIAMMVGGCGQMGSSPEEEPEKTPAEMDPADLPPIDEFQNEYSREMMVSTEPVADGYYLMRSKIGAFTIWFPEEAVFMDNASGVDGDHYEKLRFAYESEEENRGFLVDFQYNYGGNAKKPERLLDNLRGRWDYEEEWREMEDEHGLTYFGSKVEDMEGYKRYVVIGYKVSSQDAPQGMELLYIASCVDKEAESCQMDLVEEEEYVLQWMKSIQFSGTRGHGGETNGE